MNIHDSFSQIYKNRSWGNMPEDYMNKRKNKMNLTGNSFITNHRSTKLDAE